ncbi:glycosyltransferase [Pseudacidovorax intermedius]|uniref:glycosyltransferase n=1 Tax=Pseudacidovorax intermedius TaxID=433924 RepID=UPI0009EB35CF|nr:glycosyltransferase [Pseudacidovorax intermedius]
MIKKLSIVTMTYNCSNEVDSYLKSFQLLDRTQYDWIIIDAGSTDGTFEKLSASSELFDYFISERDEGFYHGLNKALAMIRTPYYMVFGADDRPEPDLLESILGCLSADDAMLVLGGVRLMPLNKVKFAGPRWLHRFVLGRAVSHHSVGTVINMKAHALFGAYDINYRLVADALFLKKILKGKLKVKYSDRIFGEFALGGMSSKHQLRSIVETLLYQISEGSNVVVQVALASARIFKWALLSRLANVLGKNSLT